LGGSCEFSVVPICGSALWLLGPLLLEELLVYAIVLPILLWALGVECS
jgi:hypothetical protein